MTAFACLSVRCILQAAREAEKDYPEASKVIQRDFYMDDCVTGADTVQKAITLASQIDKILSAAGFMLRKWKSNNREVLDALNKFDDDDEEGMVFSEEGQTTILGLKWLFALDKYTFTVKTPSLQGKVTKRKIVSCVSQLYDPHGYIGPVIVIGKVIIQMLWKAKLEWDEAGGDDLVKTWALYWEEIKHLEKFRMDRWVGTSDELKTKLIGFSDSSQMAYGISGWLN